MEMPKERPILFNTAMVKAIMRGIKTQTRRIIKPQPLWVADPSVPFKTSDCDPKGIINSPLGRRGDRLWVRETWAYHPDFPESARRAIYRADPESKYDVDRWRPSIHMPRWASRISLDVVGVRIERLKEISVKDAMAEGIEPRGMIDHRIEFQWLWESIYGIESWRENPWVWVAEFAKR